MGATAGLIMLPNGSMRAVKELTCSFLCDQLQAFGVQEPNDFLKPYLRTTPAAGEKGFLKLLIHHSYNRAAGPNIIGRSVATREAAFDELVCHYDPRETSASFCGYVGVHCSRKNSALTSSRELGQRIKKEVASTLLSELP
jgi:hypothetical protein